AAAVRADTAAVAARTVVGNRAIGHDDGAGPLRFDAAAVGVVARREGGVAGDDAAVLHGDNASPPGVGDAAADVAAGVVADDRTVQRDVAVGRGDAAASGDGAAGHVVLDDVVVKRQAGGVVPIPDAAAVAQEAPRVAALDGHARDGDVDHAARRR